MYNCHLHRFSRSTCIQCARLPVEQKNKELESQISQSEIRIREIRSQYAVQIRELQSQYTLQTKEIQSQSALQMTNLQSRLTFLGLQCAENGFPEPDVVILVQNKNDEPLHAHKLILADKSPVFRKMFEAEMLENDTGIIRIDDATFPAMLAVIRFCYYAEIEFVDEVNAEEVLAVAHKYEISFLQTICEEHLMETIDKVNLPRRMKLAKKYELKKLQVKALKFLKDHFDEVTDVLIDEVV